MTAAPRVRPRYRLVLKHHDDGAAGLLTLWACVSLFAISAVIPTTAALARLHTEADTAADLSALAAASQLLGGVEPCASGRQIATANGATLISCRVHGMTVSVRVSVPLPRPLNRLSPTGGLTARAKAEVPTGLPDVARG